MHTKSHRRAKTHKVAPMPFGASFANRYRSRAGAKKSRKNAENVAAAVVAAASASAAAAANMNQNQNRYRSRAGAHNKSHSKTQQTIVLTFIEMLDTIKLHHWRTMSHATHKATDDIYSKLSENVDQFVEIMLGKSGERIDLTRVHSVPLYDYGDDKQFKNKIESYKQYMIDLTKNTQINLDGNTDLMNVRDEILGNLNQLTYLLTFK
jgi:hypothetical protein